MKIFGRRASLSLVMAAGMAVSAAQAEPVVSLVAGTGVLPEGVAASTVSITTVEHLSASPGGAAVMVARMAGPGLTTTNNQWVFARPAEGAWSVRWRAGDKTIADLPGGMLGTLIAPPIVNDRGEVLVVASITAPNTTGAMVTTPAMLVAEEGAVRLKIRFNTASGPGTVFGAPVNGVMFGSPTMDSYRFSDAGATYASFSSGLIGPCGAGLETMCMRTLINRQGSQTGSSNTTGMSVPVGAAHSAIGFSAGGIGVQVVKASGYTREGLTGMLMWDSWGIPTFAVRDGTTPVQGLADQFILSTGVNPGATNDTMLRVGVNTSCATVFPARFGAIPPNSGVPTGPTGFVPPLATTATPLGLFLKEPGQNARLLVRSTTSNSPGTAVPGLSGAVMSQFSAPVINRAGHVVFTATLSGAGATRSSIWSTDKSGALTAIAITGVPAGADVRGTPPQTGAMYQAITSEPMLNARGQVVFTARITGPASDTAGVPTTYDAVVGYDPGAGAQVLARSGQMVDMTDQPARAISFSGFPVDIGGRPVTATGNDDGAATVLTDDGDVYFRAALAGGGLSAFTVRIAGPVGACCRGSSCEVVAAADCTGPGVKKAGTGTVCGTAGDFTTPCCIADYDQGGTVTVEDLFGFLQGWFARAGEADVNGDASVSIDDLLGYVAAYAAGGC